MEIFLPLAGGALIGLAASALLFGAERIAGVSSILGGVLARNTRDTSWRAAFLLGLLVAGGGAVWLAPERIATALERPWFVLLLAGLLVGFGTSLGSGCTSGHGVCGISRLSPRSFAATATFMLTGALAAFAARQLFGS